MFKVILGYVAWAGDSVESGIRVEGVKDNEERERGKGNCVTPPRLNFMIKFSRTKSPSGTFCFHTPSEDDVSVCLTGLQPMRQPSGSGKTRMYC